MCARSAPNGRDLGEVTHTRTQFHRPYNQGRMPTSCPAATRRRKHLHSARRLGRAQHRRVLPFVSGQVLRAEPEPGTLQRGPLDRQWKELGEDVVPGDVQPPRGPAGALGCLSQHRGVLRLDWYSLCPRPSALTRVLREGGVKPPDTSDGAVTRAGGRCEARPPSAAPGVWGTTWGRAPVQGTTACAVTSSRSGCLEHCVEEHCAAGWWLRGQE